MGKYAANSSADRWQTRRWAIEAIVMQLCLRELIDGWTARVRAVKMYDERTKT